MKEEKKSRNRAICKKKDFGRVRMKVKQMCWTVLLCLWWGIGNIYASEEVGIRLVGQWDYGSNEVNRTLVASGDTVRIRVEGNIAYLVASFLWLIDVSNPEVPVGKGFYYSPANVNDVFVSGDYAYAAVGLSLHIIDVSNPASPRQVGSCNLEHEDCYDCEARSVWAAGNYAYVGYEDLGGGGGITGGLFVIDITNPASPQEKSNLYTSNAVEELFVRGNYAYTAYLFQGSHYNYSGGMNIIDLSNPLSPVKVGTAAVSDLQFYARDIHVSGDYAYLAMGHEDYQEMFGYPSHMKIIDVSDPLKPQLAGTYQNKGVTRGIYVSGNFAYTAEGSKGLRIINVSRPYSPFEVTDYNTPEDAMDVFVSGDYIYVAYAKPGLAILKLLPSFTEKPFIMTDKTGLSFGAAPGTCTSHQEVSVTNGNVGTLNWTAAASRDWLTMTPTSGTGDAILRIGVDPTGLSTGTYTGHINITDPNASNSPRVIDVTLAVYSHKNDSAPFGTFETPLDGSTVISSIPVTGWVLDNIEPLPVQIYREPVTGEGSKLIYIGDAVFVEGARPDVEEAYPGYPFNYKAGWGYMLLTNFFPDGGNGTFTLHAIAADITGNKVTLGTKTIVCDNANAYQPFGAIDTPGQGGTASGDRFINWGWVLTPQPNSIPTDGTTIKVWVDGVDIGNPVYNIYRSDIAALFPGYANSNGAAGYFYLDTTAYVNGVHTLQWTASDDAWNQDGIGSRYFLVSNSSANPGKQTRESRLYLPRFDEIPEDFSMPILVKWGYNEDNPVKEVQRDKNGMNRVVIKELERIQVYLSGQSSDDCSYSGFMKVGRRLQALPTGSTLDDKKGVFYWLPGPGFLGCYRLVFVETFPDGTMIKKTITVEILPGTADR